MNASARKPVIGILGGVGAGKSAAAAEFAALGCRVVDADRIGHELLRDEAVKQALWRRWGESIVDSTGEVNRKALGKVVFSDPDALADLNRILHPLIRAEMEAQIARAQEEAGVQGVVIDAALLLEAHWDDLCTHMIFVEAPEAQRLHRTHQQRGWEKAVWEAREKSQIPLDKKRKACYDSVVNSSSVSCLREQIRDIFNRIVHAKDDSRSDRR